MENGGEGRPARPGQVAFQKFDNGLPGGDANSNKPSPLHKLPEQQYYRELLGGFFAKLTRWQTLLADKTFLKEKEEGLDGEFRSFSVIATPGGSLIVPPYHSDSVVPVERPDLILGIGTMDVDKPEYQHYNRRFTIIPGQAGREALVDRNGETLKYIQIGVHKYGHIQWLSIFAQIASVGDDPDLGNYDSLEVEYEDNREKLTRGLSSKGSKLMPDAYASHLLTTIDTLIPDTVGGSPQSAEKPTPKLPIPGK